MIERSSWKQEKETIKSLNSDLYNAISFLNPADNIPIYRISYDYGDRIMLDGKFCVTDESGINCLIQDSNIPEAFKDDLAYETTIPMALVLTRSVELFVNGPERVIPFGLSRPGSLIGLNCVINPGSSFDFGNFWQMTAGCRSTFFTTSIGNSHSLTNLADEFSLDIRRPDSYYDHWNIFKDIHKNSADDWQVELLFFPKQWFIETEDLSWRNFRLFLYEEIWSRMKFWKNHHILDFIYSRMLSKCTGSLPNVYINQLVKHLMYMSIGLVPGFIFPTDDEEIPRAFLNETFNEVYKFKSEQPILVALSDINYQKGHEVYYSMAVQTCHEFTLSSRKHTRKIQDLGLILKLIRSLSSLDWQGDLYGNQETLFRTFFDSSVVAFHYGVDPVKATESLKNTSCILSEDEGLSKIDGLDEVNTSSPFFGGIIKIKK